MSVTHQTAKTEFISADDGGPKYAYRRFGAPKEVPLLFLMHFRGTMDYWDPLLINSIAAHREVILFDNAGVGQTNGKVASSGKEMAQHVIIFLSLLKLTQVDVFGFSLGAMIAPLVYLNGPKNLVRRLVLASATPTWGPDVAYYPTEHRIQVTQLLCFPKDCYDQHFGPIFFLRTPTSRAAGEAVYKRIFERNSSTSGEDRSLRLSHHWNDGGVALKAQITTLQGMTDPANRAEGTYDRLGDIKIPVFIGQGKEDITIPAANGLLLQQKLLCARLKVFPDSGHGFLYQFAEEFAEDVRRFLDADIKF